ncbi:MAG: GreA/GreB family elongation factor [bacterium]|nr:GreA/GreB family elongation factor [bacterium]
MAGRKEQEFRPDAYYITREIFDQLSVKLKQFEEKIFVHYPREYENAAHPDWRENSPKDVLDHEWGLDRGELFKLQDRLRRAVVVDDLEVLTGTAGPGVKVTVEDHGGACHQYVMLSITDTARGYLSINSPVGRAIIGKKIGESVVVEVEEQGKVSLTIKEIEPFSASPSVKIPSPLEGRVQGSTEKEENLAPGVDDLRSPLSVEGNKRSVVTTEQELRFQQIVEVIKREKWPISTHTTKRVHFSERGYATNETLIFNFRGEMVRLVLEWVKVGDGKDGAVLNSPGIKGYKFINGKWQEIKLRFD